jgi:hypothetical protein
MELAANEPGMRNQLHNFRELSVGRGAAHNKPVLLKEFAVFVVQFVSEAPRRIVPPRRTTCFCSERRLITG